MKNIFKIKKTYTLTSIVSILLFIILLLIYVIFDNMYNDIILFLLYFLPSLFVSCIFIEVKIDNDLYKKRIEDGITNNISYSEEKYNNISIRAYEIYLGTGNQNELENWSQAEKELEQEENDWDQYQEDYE